VIWFSIKYFHSFIIIINRGGAIVPLARNFPRTWYSAEQPRDVARQRNQCKLTCIDQQYCFDNKHYGYTATSRTVRSL